MKLEPDANDDLSRDWLFGIAVLGPNDALVTEHRTPLTLHQPETEIAEGEQRDVLVAVTLSGLVVRAYGPHRVHLTVDGAEAKLSFAVVPLET